MRFTAVIDLIIVGFACVSFIVSIATANVNPEIYMPVESTYKAYCGNCHDNQNLVNFDKPDEELLNIINNGTTNMPAYGWLLSSKNSARVLKYMKEKQK
jgi:cytochrome c5